MLNEQDIKSQLDKFDNFVEGYRSALQWALMQVAEKPETKPNDTSAA